jgi:hypothetical protein
MLFRTIIILLLWFWVCDKSYRFDVTHPYDNEIMQFPYDRVLDFEQKPINKLSDYVNHPGLKRNKKGTDAGRKTGGISVFLR